MRRIFQPLLFFLATCRENELIRQLELARYESATIRLRVPQKHINLTAEEKKQLIKLGQAVGPGVKHIISIVSYSTYRRWIRNEASGKPPAKVGRPLKPASITETILRIARETNWGYTRILGELKKLRISVSRSTVVNTLKANGHDPGPRRGKGTWDEFLKLNAATLWQCDFFSKMIWTPTGLRQFFVLAFLHVASRKVYVTKTTCKPDSAWMKDHAEAFIEHVQSAGVKAETIIHDCDCAFVTQFDSTLSNAGITVKKVGPCAANMNAFIERWIQSIQQECLDHFVVFGEDHFNYLISEYLAHYHTERPHQSLGNKPLSNSGQAADESRGDGEIRCRERLGGLLRHYYRKAA